MRIVRKIVSGTAVPPTWEVRCEGCGSVKKLRCWKHQITPERRCGDCAVKPRLARLRGAA